MTAFEPAPGERSKGAPKDRVHEVPSIAGASREAAQHIDVTRARVAARSRVREMIFGTDRKSVV